MLSIKCLKRFVSLILVITFAIAILPVSLSAQSDGDSIITTQNTLTNSEDAEYNTSTAASGKDDIEDWVPTGGSSRARTISNGIYAISKQNTTSYISCATITGGTYLSQQTFSSAPASEAQRYAMFKIVYRPSTDDYVIRIMNNNEVVVYANKNNNAPLSLRMQNTNNVDVPTEKAWKITATSDGFYHISCTLDGTTYYMYMPSSGTLQLTTDSTLSGTKWNFHRYTGDAFKGWGKIGNWPDHIENGSSVTIEAYIYSTALAENRAYFNDSVVDPDVAEATRLSYSAQMTITPKYGGNTVIQIETNTSSEPLGYQYITSGWDTGSFFIKNKFSNEYLTMLDSTSNYELRLTSLPNGTRKEYTLWNMTYVSNGYYRIVQDIGGDSIYGNNSTAANLRCSTWDNSNLQPDMMWKFVAQSDGSFKIQSSYQDGKNPDHFMSLDNTSTKNIRSLANTGDKQLWYITPLNFNMNILYDQAFIDRHGSSNYHNVIEYMFGDNSVNYSVAKSLFDNVGIRMNYTYESTSLEPFASFPYEKGCLKRNDITATCLNQFSDISLYNCSTTGQNTEADDCNAGLHHKRWTKFDDNLPTSDSYISILFTGHRGCGVSSQTSLHTESANVAGFAGNKEKIVILGQSGINTDGNFEAQLLLHEMIHVLGVPEDAYNYNDQSIPQFDPAKAYRMECVMGFYRASPIIRDNLVICSNCINIIMLNKYRFYNH